MDGDDEGLLKSDGVELVEAMLARRLASRGVRRTLLLSEDMALKLAARPLSPLPCLPEEKLIYFFLNLPKKVDMKSRLVSDWSLIRTDRYDFFLTTVKLHDRCKQSRSNLDRRTSEILLSALCVTDRPVVVQHDTVGRLVVAEADVVVELSQLFTQDHQLVLSSAESLLVLLGY